MNNDFEIIIVGGGVIGLSAALAMQQKGFTVALFDANDLVEKEDLAIDARVYAINEASTNLLKELGAWEHIDALRLAPYRQMHVWDAVSGAHIDFNSRLVAAPQLGFIVEELVLKNALLKKVKACEKITLFANTQVIQVEEKEQAVIIQTVDDSYQANLMIIADGGLSPTRQALGVQVTTWPYHQQAIVTTVHNEKPHLQTAYQVFSKDGPLAFLPLADPNQCSIVWSIQTRRARVLMAMNDDEFSEALTASIEQKLGPSQVIGLRYQFPLHMRHSKQYVGNHWLLMGDAAHTIHPLAGLGLNIGLADVMCWIKVIGKSRAFTRKILGAYQRQRKNDVWQTILLMESLKTIFMNPLRPVSMLRGLGLKACNKTPYLLKLFIKKANG